MKRRIERQRWNRISDPLFGVLLTVPVFVLLAGVMVFPLVRIITLSFYKYKVFEGGALQFIGLRNYVTALTDPGFWNALKNTLVFTVVTVGSQMIGGLVIAVLLDRSVRARGVLRMTVLLPWALPTIINSLLFRWMFDGNFGLFNDILMRLHVISRQVSWLASPFGANFAIDVTQIWKVSSLVGLILLAGLQSIPRSLYESARVDGAGEFLQFFRITLPLLKPAILVALIFRTLIALQVFDVIFAMTRGGPGDTTESLVYAIYMQTFRYTAFGYSSSLSVLLSILILAFGFLYVRSLYRNESATGMGA